MGKLMDNYPPDYDHLQREVFGDEYEYHCPHCDSTNVYAEREQHQQIMPAECLHCGARDFYSQEDCIDASDVEVLAGWWLPEGEKQDPEQRASFTPEQVQLVTFKREAALGARATRVWQEAKREERAAALRGYHDNALF